jgi:hypothetical protein
MRSESAPSGAVTRAPRFTPAHNTDSGYCCMTRGCPSDNGPGSNPVRSALRFGRWHVPFEFAKIPLPRVTGRIELDRGIVAASVPLVGETRSGISILSQTLPCQDEPHSFCFGSATRGYQPHQYGGDDSTGYSLHSTHLMI